MAKDFVTGVDAPATRESLVADLRNAGVRAGMTLVVHSSLSAMGYVCGGAVAVVQALLDAVAPGGTLAMPAHTADISEPSRWRNPPVPEEWWPIIREHMPVFDARVTPTRYMGTVVEVFRTWPGTQRSEHPAVSFTANGPQAERITANHQLEFALGDGSPLARLYDLDAQVLLLGVGYDRSTCFHLAEFRSGARGAVEEGAPILEDGRRVWKKLRDLDFDETIFPRIGALLEDAGRVTFAQVGAARCRLFSVRPAVDFAVEWMREQP